MEDRTMRRFWTVVLVAGAFFLYWFGAREPSVQLERSWEPNLKYSCPVWYGWESHPIRFFNRLPPSEIKRDFAMQNGSTGWWYVWVCEGPMPHLTEHEIRNPELAFKKMEGLCSWKPLPMDLEYTE